MAKSKIIPTKEQILELYQNQKKTMKEVAKELSVSRVKLGKLFKLYEIASKGAQDRWVKNPKYDYDINHLYDLHWNKGISLTNIAKTIGYASNVSIIKIFRKNNLPTRDSKAATRLANTGDNNPAKRLEVREKLSGENNHFYGKKHSDESKEKMSAGQKEWDRTEWNKVRWTEARKLEYKENNPMKNEEYRLKHAKVMRETRSGENCYWWMGGKTETKSLLRECFEYKEWHRQILKRDNFTCLHCGSKKELEVDHIKPFSLIILENNINTFEDGLNCEKLWDIENGRTLCFPCHAKTDTYGVGVKNYYEKYCRDVGGRK